MVWKIFAAVLAAVVACSGGAAGALLKGVNLPKAGSVQAIDLGDAKLVAAAGFDHVRIPLRQNALTESAGSGNVSPRALAQLRDKLRAMRGYGLQAIVDLHAEGAYRKDLLDDAALREDFVRYWVALARGLADIDGLYLELLNEPVGDSEEWWDLQGEVIRKIRRVNKRHVIIVSGVRSANLTDLIRHEPYADKHVIYNFHFYSPMLFTHQGATWGKAIYRDVANVPWPMTIADQQRALEAGDLNPDAGDLLQPGRLVDKLRVRKGLDAGLVRGNLTDWDRAQLDKKIEKVVRWSREHGVPLLCDEFGAYAPKQSDPANRIRYLTDVVNVFAKYRIPWTVWSLKGGFGIVDRRDGNIDPGVARALGLARSPEPPRN